MDAEEAKQDHARTAIGEFVQRPAVFLVPGASTDAPTAVASGVALLTPGDIVTVLTAWHVAKDAQNTPHRLGYRGCDPGLNDVVRGIIPGPARERRPEVTGCEEGVDVALVLVSDDAQRVLRSMAITIENIASDDDVDDNKDVVVLSGYPFYLSGALDSSPKSRGYSHIHHITGVRHRDDCGRLHLSWDDAVVRPGDEVPPHVDVKPGEVFRLGHPGGISGGAVWRFRGAKKEQPIWAPSSDGQIIGVPMAWDKVSTEIAESCCLWRDWLLESVAKVDERYATGGST